MQIMQFPGQFTVKKAPSWKAFLAAKGAINRPLTLVVTYLTLESKVAHEGKLLVQVDSITPVTAARRAKRRIFKQREVTLTPLRDDGVPYGTRYTFTCRPMPLVPGNNVKVKRITVTLPHRPH